MVGQGRRQDQCLWGHRVQCKFVQEWRQGRHRSGNPSYHWHVVSAVRTLRGRCIVARDDFLPGAPLRVRGCIGIWVGHQWVVALVVQVCPTEWGWDCLASHCTESICTCWVLRPSWCCCRDGVGPVELSKHGFLYWWMVRAFQEGVHSGRWWQPSFVGWAGSGSLGGCPPRVVQVHCTQCGGEVAGLG